MTIPGRAVGRASTLTRYALQLWGVWLTFLTLSTARARLQLNGRAWPSSWAAWASVVWRAAWASVVPVRPGGATGGGASLNIPSSFASGPPSHPGHDVRVSPSGRGVPPASVCPIVFWGGQCTGGMSWVGCGWGCGCQCREVGVGWWWVTFEFNWVAVRHGVSHPDCTRASPRASRSAHVSVWVPPHMICAGRGGGP